MDKFLEIYNLPTLNQEEIDNLKRPVISNEIEFVLNQKKKISSKQKYTDNITGEFHQTYKSSFQALKLLVLSPPSQKYTKQHYIT